LLIFRNLFDLGDIVNELKFVAKIMNLCSFETNFLCFYYFFNLKNSSRKDAKAQSFEHK